MFDKAFTGSPEQRPSAERWAAHLQSILDNKILGRCDAHPYDIRHMHLADKPCPACFLSAVEKNGSIIVPRTVIDKSKLYVPEAAVPAAAPTSQPSDFNWFWLVAAIIVLFVVVANIVKVADVRPPSPPAYVAAPAPTPEQLATDDASRRSERMKKLFDAKDYYGVINEARSGRFMSRDLDILGISFSSTGQLDDAIDVYKQAEKTFPNFPIVKRDLGDALLANGQSIAAIEKYREALAIEPSNISIQQRLKNAESEEQSRNWFAEEKRRNQIAEEQRRTADRSHARGVPPKNETRNSAAGTSYPSRDMEAAARMEREAEIEKAARMERTAILERERLEKERLEKERLEKERLEKERLEKEIPESVRLENNRKWLEREREDYRNRSF